MTALDPSVYQEDAECRAIRRCSQCKTGEMGCVSLVQHQTVYRRRRTNQIVGTSYRGRVYTFACPVCGYSIVRESPWRLALRGAAMFAAGTFGALMSLGVGAAL